MYFSRPSFYLPIRVASDSAFIFQVLILPVHRGRRLYAAILSNLTDELQNNGIRHFVLTTEGSSRNSLRAVERVQSKKSAKHPSSASDHIVQRPTQCDGRTSDSNRGSIWVTGVDKSWSDASHLHLAQVPKKLDSVLWYRVYDGCRRRLR